MATLKRSVKGAATQAAAADTRARAKELKTRTQVVKKGSAVDSFQNFADGLGIGTNNTFSAASYGFNPITRIRIILEWAHRGSWIAGQAVDVVAEDMTRAGVEIIGELKPGANRTCRSKKRR